MTVLLLGWKSGFAEILPMLGLRFVVVLGNEEREKYDVRAIDCGEIIHVRDISDAGRLLPALARAGLADEKFTHVHTDHEFAIVPAALLARHFGSAGMPVHTAMLSRDKWLQKQAVARSDVRVPWHVLLPDDPVVRNRLLDEIPYPALLKPISSASGRNTGPVSDSADVRRALAAVRPEALDTEAFLLEEIIEGTELHADGLIREGRVEFVSVSRYRAHVLEARKSAAVSSTVLDPRRHGPLYDRVREVAERSMAAMRLADSAFHLEVFQSDGGLIFSECGARTGGSLITEMVEAKFGVQLRRHALAMAFDQPVDVHPRLDERTFTWSYLPAPAGQVRAVPTHGELYRLPGVVRAETVTVIPPEPADKPRRLGLALVEGADEQDAERRMDAVVAWFRDHVKVDGP